jgi:hypothetical protein
MVCDTSACLPRPERFFQVVHGGSAPSANAYALRRGERVP